MEKRYSPTSLPLRASRIRAALGLLLIVLISIRGSNARSATQSLTPPRTPKGYRALQSFLLNQPGEHVFHFRQAQSREMTLVLEVEQSTGEPDRLELTHLRATIEATLFDSRRRNVCRAGGANRRQRRASQLESEDEPWGSGVLAPGLRRDQAEGSRVVYPYYRLRQVDLKKPDIKVTPVFEPSEVYGP
jgi:hypothetical protein